MKLFHLDREILIILNHSHTLISLINVGPTVTDFEKFQLEKKIYCNLKNDKNDVKLFHLDRENLDSLNILNQIIWIIWIKLSGSNYLEQIIWIKLSESNYLVQIIWIKLFWILLIILNYFHINFFTLIFHNNFSYNIQVPLILKPL